MKRTTNSSSRFAVVLSALIAASACTDDGLGLDSNAPEFDIDVFEQNVIDGMLGTVGWAYVINQDGNLARSGAFGDARSADDGQLDFTTSKHINIASITKFLTAIAVMQLLDERNLTVDDEIEPWLPADWTLGPGVDELTFRDLMSHGSGLNSTNTNFSGTLCYDCLAAVIEEGVTQSKAYNYLNANFALFRVMIPMMWAGLQGGPAFVIPTEATTSAIYAEYVEENLFAPIGLTGASLLPEDPATATLYYAVGDPSNGINGIAYGDWTDIAGGGGYYMSTQDIARILAFYEHSNTLVSDAARTTMKSNLCGFDLHSNSFEQWGEYFHKNGGITNGRGQGVMTEAIIFPNGVEIAVTTNTAGLLFPFGDSFRQMIYRAFNNAWE